MFCAMDAEAATIHNEMLSEVVVPKKVPIPPLKEQSEFIDRLGGSTKVAAMLSRRMGEKVSQQSVTNWRKRGIPHRFRPSMALEGRDRDIGCPPNFIGEPPPAERPPNEVPFL